MKKTTGKSKSVVKGAPSGFVISLMVHAAAFMLAGLLVVFTVHKKEEKKFEPPKPVERPKMKLKKPKVKVKKSAKPKASQRIVTKVQKANMPDIELPEMSGIGEGFAGGIGGFDILPSLDEITLFGGGQTIGNDFEGTFYDLTKNRKGRPTPMDPASYVQVVRKFIVSGWRPSTLGQYYQSPNKLYTTTFTIPTVLSQLAPESFGEPDASTYCWLAHYKGQLVYPEDIKFRFWGNADDLMVVRVDGEVVLNANYERHGNETDTVHVTPMWSPYSSKSRTRWLGCSQAEIGNWIELKANEPVDMEVVIGEVPGGLFQSLLMVEVEGVDYERSSKANGPILPIFKTAPIERDLVEIIYKGLDPEDGIVTNGPVFCDYPTRTPSDALMRVEQEPISADEVSVEPDVHVWSSADGKKFEGEYLTVMGQSVVLKTAREKQVKVPFSDLSEADREFVGLLNPPRFNINFSKKSDFVPPPPLSPYEGIEQRPLQLFDYTFGAELKQTSAGTYEHKLKVEYFAIGEEVDGDNYVLLDRGEDSFIPSEPGKEKFSFSGEPVRIRAMAFRASAPVRGVKYGSFLIVVTDKRGEIIQYKTPKDWLFDIAAELRELPVGKHFNKAGERTYPPRPGEQDRPSWY